MRCLGRIGCLLLVLLLAAAAWATRGMWLDRVPGLHRTRGAAATDSSAGGAGGDAASAAGEGVWQPLDPKAGARGKRAIDALASPKGPVYTNLSASEIASYVFQTVGHAMPANADSVEATVKGDVLYVRAIVPMKDIAASGALGPLGGLLNERERISLGGGFRVVKPGLSEFTVREVRLRDFKVPSAAIPRLVQQLTKGKRTEGIGPSALPVATPRSLGDVRIANGRVTLYKTTAGAP